MPITQARMTTLISDAEAFRNALEVLALRIREANARVLRNLSTPADELASLEWFADPVNNFPSAEAYANHRANLTIERKWFDKNGRENQRRAQRAADRRLDAGTGAGVIPQSGPAIASTQGLTRWAGTGASPSPSTQPQRSIADEVKIADFAQANNLDHETAAGILGFPMRLGGGGGSETPLPSDNDPESFEGLGTQASIEGEASID